MIVPVVITDWTFERSGSGFSRTDGLKGFRVRRLRFVHCGRREPRREKLRGLGLGFKGLGV